MSTPTAPAVHRPPTDLDLFCFFSELWTIASLKSAGQGFKNGTDCPFTTDDLKAALRKHGVQESDLDTAIEHCLEMEWLERRGDGPGRG